MKGSLVTSAMFPSPGRSSKPRPALIVEWTPRGRGKGPGRALRGGPVKGRHGKGKDEKEGKEYSMTAWREVGEVGSGGMYGVCKD